MRRTFLNIALAGLMTFSAPAASASAFEEDFKDLSDQQVKDTVEFAFGNALFFLFHEAGHMLVSEYNLPVLGKEEDAVDTLSTLLLLEADAEVFDTALIDSVDGWTFSAEESEEEEQAMWGAHALDRQRAFNMVCLMVGKDAKKFKESADDLEMPKSRREECVDEYKKARDSWFGLLKPHLRTDDKRSKFTINYKGVKNNELKGYVEITKSAQVLEILQKLVSDLYVLKDGIKLTAAQCGEPNAYWSAKSREVTYCYELMQWHSKAIANYFREDEGEEEEGTSEDTSANDNAKPILRSVKGTATAR